MGSMRNLEVGHEPNAVKKHLDLGRSSRGIHSIPRVGSAIVLILAVSFVFYMLPISSSGQRGNALDWDNVKRRGNWGFSWGCGNAGVQTGGAICVPDAIWRSIQAEDARAWRRIDAGVTHKDGTPIRKGFKHSYEDDSAWNHHLSSYILSKWMPTLSCPQAARVGADGDGAKWTCGVENIARNAIRGDCLVYSLGSNNNFDFESDLLERLGDNCEVHVFDHTVTTWKPPSTTKNIHTHSIALTSEAGAKARGSPFKSYQEIRKMLGHETRTINIFKIDIEGSEYEVLPEVLKDAEHPVGQILVEIHMTQHAARSIGATDRLLYRFRNASYHMFHTETNPYASGCYEFSFLHVSN
jgi:Methyltransferase domain